MDAATAGILGVAVGSGLGIVSIMLQQHFQNSRERSQQAHELKRDQRAKQYEFTLLEYKERRDACSDLLLAVRYARVEAKWEYDAHIGKMNPVDAAALHGALSGEAVAHGMRVLLVDKDAEEIIKRYSDLPTDEALTDPFSDEALQTWRDGVNRLQEAIYAYLHTLQLRLFSDETKPTSR